MLLDFNNCNEIKNNLSAYLDKELSEEDSLAVESHLSNCHDCLNELELLKNLSEKTKQCFLEKDFDIPDFSLNIIERLNNDSVKISCEEVCENLSSYFDGELDTPEYYRVEEHIQSCEKCTQKYRTLEKLRDLISLSVNNNTIDCWQEIYSRLINSDNVDCPIVISHLSDYVDKEINDKLSKAISAHILTCKNCRNSYEQIKYIKNITQKALMEPAKSINMWSNVRNRLIKDNNRYTFAASSVASIITIFLVWYSLNTILPYNSLNNKSVANEYNDNIQNTGNKASNSDIIANNMNGSDNYMFSNAFNFPTTNVLPFYYYDNGFK